MRRALVLAAIATTVAALVATWFGLAHRADQVASIDGHSVTRDELLFHMRRLAPTVQNELRNDNGLRGAIDWTTPIGDGDGTALDRLESAAFDEIWRDKTTLLAAQDQGLTVPADYEAFLAELAEENEHRASALAKGETVYGVGEFSPEQYYSHRLAEITTALKERLSADADGPLWVGDEDVRHAFDADRAEWSANATTFSYSTLVVPVPDDASPGFAASLQRQIAATKQLADVAAHVPGATHTTGTCDGGEAGVSAHDQDLRAVLDPLDPGEISGPIAGAGQITYYQLNDRTVDEDAAFDAYAQRIRLSIVEEKYQQFVQRRVDSSDIQIDAAAVDAINAEDVQQ